MRKSWIHGTFKWPYYLTNTRTITIQLGPWMELLGLNENKILQSHIRCCKPISSNFCDLNLILYIRVLIQRSESYLITLTLSLSSLNYIVKDLHQSCHKSVFWCLLLVFVAPLNKHQKQTSIKDFEENFLDIDANLSVF